MIILITLPYLQSVVTDTMLCFKLKYYFVFNYCMKHMESFRSEESDYYLNYKQTIFCLLSRHLYFL